MYTKIFDINNHNIGQFLFFNNNLYYINKFFIHKKTIYLSIIEANNNLVLTFSFQEFNKMKITKKITLLKTIYSKKYTYTIGEKIYLQDLGNLTIKSICKSPYQENKNISLQDENNIIKLETENHKIITYTIKELDEKLTINETKEEINFRKKYLPEFRTDDGHYVRSQGEMIIDNWLYNNNIIHEYERKIILNNEEYFADFYIKNKNLYIEYFGLTNNDDYNKKTEHKKTIYEKNNISCIYLYPEDLKNIQDILQKMIIDKIDNN